ncbi:hypothetical protein [Stigmatella erecta]|uniref:hypothetical protein n=1 Tax=Stigmatella erecta TaxID=83460 RepID=UPI001FE33F2C|nr:hypothetical protein [Stigmatella erecta]
MHIEAGVTSPIANTSCVLEATEPSQYGPNVDNVYMISAQASIYDCGQSYPVLYTCSVLEKKSVSSTGTVTWTAVAGTRSCYGDTNSSIGGQTSNPITYSAGTYRQRAQGAVKLNATKWSPAQPSTCSTLSSNVPCTLKEVVSNPATL